MLEHRRGRRPSSTDRRQAVEAARAIAPQPIAVLGTRSATEPARASRRLRFADTTGDPDVQARHREVQARSRAIGAAASCAREPGAERMRGVGRRRGDGHGTGTVCRAVLAGRRAWRNEHPDVPRERDRRHRDERAVRSASSASARGDALGSPAARAGPGDLWLWCTRRRQRLTGVGCLDAPVTRCSSADAASPAGRRRRRPPPWSAPAVGAVDAKPRRHAPSRPRRPPRGEQAPAPSRRASARRAPDLPALSRRRLLRRAAGPRSSERSGSARPTSAGSRLAEQARAATPSKTRPVMLALRAAGRRGQPRPRARRPATATRQSAEQSVRRYLAAAAASPRRCSCSTSSPGTRDFLAEDAPTSIAGCASPTSAWRSTRSGTRPARVPGTQIGSVQAEDVNAVALYTSCADACARSSPARCARVARCAVARSTGRRRRARRPAVRRPRRLTKRSVEPRVGDALRPDAPAERAAAGPRRRAASAAPSRNSLSRPATIRTTSGRTRRVAGSAEPRWSRNCVMRAATAGLVGPATSGGDSAGARDDGDRGAGGDRVALLDRRAPRSRRPCGR